MRKITTSILAIFFLSVFSLSDANAQKKFDIKDIRKVYKSVEMIGGKITRDLKIEGEPTTINLNNSRITDKWLADNIKGFQKHLENVTTLAMGNSKITDVGLKEMIVLSDVEDLILSGTAITSDGLKELVALKKLKRLYISKNKNITDAALKNLSGLNLETLDLRQTKITNTGLQELAEFRSLRYLGVSQTQTTGIGISALRKALPQCIIK